MLDSERGDDRTSQLGRFQPPESMANHSHLTSRNCIRARCSMSARHVYPCQPTGRTSNRGIEHSRCRPSREQETILEKQLKPAALRAGTGKIGWHTSVPVLVEQYAVVGDENDAKVAAQRWRFGPKAFKTYFNVRDSKKILRLANSKIRSERAPYAGMAVHSQYVTVKLGCKLLLLWSLRLVAGGGFEPPTFGL